MSSKKKTVLFILAFIVILGGALGAYKILSGNVDASNLGSTQSPQGLSLIHIFLWWAGRPPLCLAQLRQRFTRSPHISALRGSKIPATPFQRLSWPT